MGKGKSECKNAQFVCFFMFDYLCKLNIYLNMHQDTAYFSKCGLKKNHKRLGLCERSFRSPSLFYLYVEIMIFS